MTGKHRPLLLAIAAAWLLGATGIQGAWQDRVQPGLLEQASAGGAVECLVFLDEQADLTSAASLRGKAEKGWHVYERLTEVAERTQAPLLGWLEERSIPHRPFWIANAIWVEADLEIVAALASREDVRRIDANPRVRLRLVSGPAAPGAEQATGSIEWNIGHVNADQVWALGYDGTGIVVGGQDTGYDWDHPALRDHYRGWDGATADHDFNWHDATHSGGGDCGSDLAAPCDDHNHGTHTMGTIVGDDGGANRIGMAPGAEWIGCRNMDEGIGTPASYIECFQFMVAPTDLAGNDPDPSLAPHVISNSWGCPTSEGCSPDALLEVVENTRAAGIVIVASAGNSGPSCSSIEEPPGTYDAVLTVGSVDSDDDIADSSGRGLVTVDGSNRMKPDVTAPGVGVRSATDGGGYGTKNGTSMAAPHVAGLVALLLDARPDLIGQVETVDEIVRRSALDRTHSKKCNGVPGSEIPNPIFGHGRIDALAALLDDSDGDGAGNLDDCAPIDETIWELPGPAVDLTIERSGGQTLLSWGPPGNVSAGAVSYDLLRAAQPDGFDEAACIVTGSSATTASDDSESEPLSCYLVRALNECGQTLGQASDSTPRTGVVCPGVP